MLKTSESKSQRYLPFVSVCLNSSFSSVQGPVSLQAAVDAWCREDKMTWEHDTSPGCPPWASQAGASGTAWGGTEGKVKVISTLSYHTNSICWWWATVSTPQRWGQSIAAGKDLRQPPEAVLGFAPCSVSNTHGTVWSAEASSTAPHVPEALLYHWICGILSR